MEHIKQFPHCDSKILHAPGVCEFCDMHPEWQELREYWGINFTGEYKLDKTPCPAELARSLDTINKWHGNVPETAQTKKERDRYFERLNRLTNEVLHRNRG